MGLRTRGESVKVLVAGGRTRVDQMHIFDVLDALHDERRITMIIEGGARGADMHAHAWAMSRGVHVAVVQAHWERLGKAAGTARNAAMLRLGPDLVVAFPSSDSKGTWNMVRQAEDAGIRVIMEEV